MLKRRSKVKRKLKIKPKRKRKRKRKGKRKRISSNNNDDVDEKSSSPIKKRKISTKLHNYGFKGSAPKVKRNKNWVDIYKTNEKFDLIYADPPWEYQKNDKPRKDMTIKVCSKYPTMNSKELEEFGKVINRIAADDCVLLMWTTSTKMAEAIKLIEQCGFKYVTMYMNWHKTNSRTSMVLSKRGCGHYSMNIAEYLMYSTRETTKKPSKFRYMPATFIVGEKEIFVDNNHYLLLGKKGKISKFRNKNKFFANVIYEKEIIKEGQELNIKPSILVHPRGIHSEKPKVLYGMIEDTFMWTTNRLEAFARNNRKGWKCWGNECKNI